MSSNYNPQSIEKDIQDKWDKQNKYVTRVDEKILLSINVSIPIWKTSHGACKTTPLEM